MWVRWASPLSLADISLRGYVPPVGPILERVPWPAVLVTKARSVDGFALDLVVEPGDAAGPAPATTHPFELSALTPGGRYRLHGGAVRRRGRGRRRGPGGRHPCRWTDASSCGSNRWRPLMVNRWWQRMMGVDAVVAPAAALREHAVRAAAATRST